MFFIDLYHLFLWKVLWMKKAMPNWFILCRRRLQRHVSCTFLCEHAQTLKQKAHVNKESCHQLLWYQFQYCAMVSSLPLFLHVLLRKRCRDFLKHVQTYMENIISGKTFYNLFKQSAGIVLLLEWYSNMIFLHQNYTQKCIEYTKLNHVMWPHIMMW